MLWVQAPLTETESGRKNGNGVEVPDCKSESKQYLRIFLKIQTQQLIMMQWKTNYYKVKLGPSLQHKGATHSTQHTHKRVELIWVSLCHSKSFCH